MKKGSHVPFYHELTMNGQIKSCFCILGNMLFAFFPVIRTKTGFPLIRFILILNNTKPASIFLNLEFLLRIEFRQVHFLAGESVSGSDVESLQISLNSALLFNI